MELIGHLDPEEAGAIVEPALKLMMDAVHRYGGYVAQSASDGIFALFGAPIAQEDHPQRALFAALRVQEVFARYAEKLHGEKGVDLQVRVGVNSGEVVVRLIKSGAGQTYIPIGRSSSLASQLLALAAPGSIAISGAMRKLVEGYFTLKPMEPTRIKGVSEPVEVYEVTGLGPLRTRLQRAAGRGLSKFVGRGPEIQAIERAAELAKAGRGQVVAAVAEPGVGKSRLYYEFEVRNQSGWMVMAFAVSHGKASAYLPVIDLLHVYFGIDSGDDVHKRREKVRGKVLMLDRALEGILPYLFALLGIAEGEPFAGMDAAVRRWRTLDAIKRILIRESLNQPLMLVFEDLHWIDEETRGLLNLMTESIGSARILLLVNYRPEYQQEWSNKTSHTQLRLEPLGKESADEMLTALLGDASDIAPLKRLIIERTEGNPFFIEETFEALLDDSALVRNGSIRLAKPLAELKIPPTVQDILASRIDRLPAAEKQLLQTAAVIGKVFGLKLLAQAAGKTDVELIPMLSELERREFTYEKVGADDIEYTFKHALTQEVAYNSVLAERRKITHHRIGDAIETLFHAHLDDHVEELAHHYGRSTNFEKARQYLRAAANQAMRRDAYEESVAYLNRALELLRSMAESPSRDREELTLQQALASAMRVARGFGAVELEEILIRLANWLNAWEIPPNAFTFWRRSCSFTCSETSGQLPVSCPAQLMAIAEESRDPAILGFAQWEAARTYSQEGNFSSAVDVLKPLLAWLSAHPEADGAGTRFWATGSIGLWLCALGRFKEADEICSVAVAEAEKLSKPFFLAVAQLVATWPDMYSGRYGKGLQRVDLVDALANQHGFPWVAVQARLSRAEILTRQGHYQQALEVGEPALEEADKVGRGVNGYRVALASALGKAGRLADAMKSVDWLLAFSRETGHQPDLSRVHHVRGELLLMFDPPRLEEAEHELREGIEVAQRQAAKWHELCATTSLAILLRDTNRRDEARAMLAEIYNWFTEGFDTADLKDAKALLEELGA